MTYYIENVFTCMFYLYLYVASLELPCNLLCWDDA